MVMLDIPLLAAQPHLTDNGENVVLCKHIFSSVGIWIAGCNTCKNDFTVAELRLLYFSICLFM